MARIFTISFVYNDEMYNAVVVVRTTPLYMEYTLNHLDIGLLRLLPGNKIISPEPKKFLFPGATPYNSIVLMNSIIKAVSMHLQISTLPSEKNT